MHLSYTGCIPISKIIGKIVSSENFAVLSCFVVKHYLIDDIFPLMRGLMTCCFILFQEDIRDILQAKTMADW